MTERVLEAYFENSASAEELAADISASQHSDHIAKGEFEVKSEHLIHLFEDTLLGKLSTNDLTAISYQLIVSDYFHWDSDIGDGGKIAEVIFELDSYDVEPEIPLASIQRWKEYLELDDIPSRTSATDD